MCIVLWWASSHVENSFQRICTIQRKKQINEQKITKRIPQITSTNNNKNTVSA